VLVHTMYPRPHRDGVRSTPKDLHQENVMCRRMTTRRDSICFVVYICNIPRPIVTVHEVHQRIYGKEISRPKVGCVVRTNIWTITWYGKIVYGRMTTRRDSICRGVGAYNAPYLVMTVCAAHQRIYRKEISHPKVGCVVRTTTIKVERGRKSGPISLVHSGFSCKH